MKILQIRLEKPKTRFIYSFKLVLHMRKRSNRGSRASNRERKQVLNQKVAKLAFVVLMVLIFLALTFRTPSFTGVTSYSVLDTVNPGANFLIFFALIVLIFFLTYEKKRLK